MKFNLCKPFGSASVLATLALAGIFNVGAVQAAGTLSNTDITNISLLSFSVGGVAQNQICSSVAGNSTSTTTPTGSTCGGGGGAGGTFTTFKVDNKVNLSVVEGSYNGTAIVNAGAVTNVTPGASAQVTSFVVTNTGNTAQGYTFTTANQVTGSLAILGTLDSIDVTINNVFVDANGDGMYDAGDTAIAISSLAPDASVTVFVVASIPAGATNGQQANITLTATTVTAITGAPVSATVGADTAGVDIVFADAATTELGFVGASAARDGQATARDAYRIASAVISVAKTSLLVCDPFNGSAAERKSIPGAIVRWTITISNAATATSSATLATVTDALNANTTFDPNLVTGAGTATPASSCASTTGALESGGASGSGFRIVQTNRGINSVLTTALAGNDGADLTGTTVTINYAQALPLVAGPGGYAAGELKAGESVTVYFNVTIN